MTTSGLDSWLDLVHGATCVGCAAPGRSLCTACASALPRCGTSVRPTPCPQGLAACFAAGEYADLLRALVLAHKEHGVFSLAEPLGRVLVAAAGPALDPSPPRGSMTVLVPVPSRAAVVRARGHDPVLRFTRVAARRLRGSGWEVQVSQLLAQQAAVRDQAGLDSVQRSANLAGSLTVRRAAREALARRQQSLSLLVCDDVLTTGATAREAQRALEQAGLRVRAVVTVAATRKRITVPLSPPVEPPTRGLPFSGRPD